MILDENERPMVAVYTGNSEAEAEVVLSILRESAIPGRINSELPRSIYPFTAGGLGAVSVLVPEGNVDAARAAIASFEEAASAPEE